MRERRKLMNKNTTNNTANVDRNTEVIKPWGKEILIFESDDYRIKKIIVNPNQRLSLQYHKEKYEHWIYLDGSIRYIPPYELHRLEGGSNGISIIEISHGSDEDIVRIEDDYGREDD